MPEEKGGDKHRTERITGAQKAAILILTLPEDAAVNVLKRLKDHELVKLAKTIFLLGTIKKDMVKLVLKEAYDELGEIAPLKTAPEELRRLLEKALPPDKLKELLEESMLTESGRVVFEELQKMDPKFIPKLIEKEYPQRGCLKVSAP